MEGRPMLLTRRYLREFQKSMRISIPGHLEKELLQEYGTPVIDDGGRVFEYTEQDIYEQLRKRRRGIPGCENWND
jgi:hypothetical protein